MIARAGSRRVDVCTVLAAVAVHAGLAVVLLRGRHAPPPRPRPPLELDYRERPAAPAAAVAHQAAAEQPRQRPAPRSRPRARVAAAPAPSAAPPRETPPPAALAPPVFGFSMASPNAAGISVPVAPGGSALGDPVRGRPGGVPGGTGDSDYHPASELEVGKMPDIDADACGRLVTYPPEAERDGIAGDVRLRVSLDERGHVRAAHVLSGLGHGLDQAAVDALKHRCKFTPATDKTGTPVAFIIQSYTFHFELPH